MLSLLASLSNPSQDSQQPIIQVQPEVDRMDTVAEQNSSVQEQDQISIQEQNPPIILEQSSPIPNSSLQVNPKIKSSKKRKSWVWEHATESKDVNGKRIGICNTCKTALPADSIHYGTTTIAEHLKRKCKNCPAYQNMLKGQPIITQVSMGTPLIPHSFSQKRCEERLVRFIIQDEMSFRMVEGVGFRQLLLELCPKLKIPNRQKVASLVWEMYHLEKAKIMSVIGKQRVSITTDTWTSIQNINYMVVTAHFMDSDWKLHKRVINFTKITSHVGLELGKSLETCLRGWGIEKVLCITVDNASSNEPAIEHVRKRLNDMNGVFFNGKYIHMRCACHIINLIVKDGLKELYSSIEAIRNCVKYIHSSPSRLEKFRVYARMLKMDQMSNIPMDVSTRWNSTYKMLESAEKYHKVFAMMEEDDLPFINYFNEKESRERKRVGPPCVDDWVKANAFVHFLEKFYESTLMLSASKTSTSHLILKVVAELLWEIDLKVGDTSNPVLQNVAISMKEKFNKYWGDFESVNKLIYVAHVLNPRWKLDIIETCFECIGYDEVNISRIVNETKRTLLSLFNEYKGVDNIVSSSLPIQIPTYSESISFGLSPFELQVKRRREAMEVADIANEVDKYFSDPCEKLDGDSFDLLNWWNVNQSWYPILSKVAKDVLAIPSSTVASESAFSLGRRIVDPFRASLTPKIVEALVCASDWIRAEDFNFYIEPTEDEVQLYKELEALEISTLKVVAPSTGADPNAS